MSLKTEAVKGSLLLTVGQGVVYGSSLVRNMILARVLTKADFGIAATFSLIMMLLEFSAKLGVGQFIVRDKDGDDAEFIATAHLVLFLVAVTSSAVIVLLAAPLGALLGIPGQRWAIMLLALAPLFRGFEHQDIRRFERHLRFSPSLLAEALPQVVITLAAWPIAIWLRDYRAVLALLLTKELASCLGSHVFAERPYRWRVRRAYVARILRFGWPLLINGFLLFGILQGDQFLIATNYSMADLAPYAAASVLTMAPAFFFARVFNSVMLPVLAKVQENPTAFAKRYRQVVAVITAFAMVLAIGMVVGGEALMRIVYGAKYAGAGILLSLLSAANAFRTLRIAPALAALAKGDSQNQMLSNSGRVMALVPALAFALTRQSLWLIACGGLLGEALACWISIVRLKRRDGVPLSTSLVPAGYVLLGVGMAGVVAIGGVHRLPPIAGFACAALGACTGGVVMMLATPALRTEALALYAGRDVVGWRSLLSDRRADRLPSVGAPRFSKY